MCICNKYKGEEETKLEICEGCNQPNDPFAYLKEMFGM